MNIFSKYEKFKNYVIFLKYEKLENYEIIHLDIKVLFNFYEIICCYFTR